MKKIIILSFVCNFYIITPIFSNYDNFLLEAVNDINLENVKQALDCGANINFTNPKTGLSITQVAINKYLEIENYINSFKFSAIATILATLFSFRFSYEAYPHKNKTKKIKRYLYSKPENVAVLTETGALLPSPYKSHEDVLKARKWHAGLSLLFSIGGALLTGKIGFELFKLYSDKKNLISILKLLMDNPNLKLDEDSIIKINKILA